MRKLLRYIFYIGIYVTTTICLFEWFFQYRLTVFKKETLSAKEPKDWWRYVFPRRRNCTKNIVFLKTHKTGGSTIQNILLRYGLRHNLTIGFPFNLHHFGFPYKFSIRWLGNYEKKRKPNVICHHMRFSYEEVSKMVPEDTVYVTVMREPGRLFQSTFAYMRKGVPSFNCYPLDNQTAAEDWLANPEKCIRKVADKSRRLLSFSMFQHNHMAYDLGFDSDMEHAVEIAQAISTIDSIFELVLITDYMEESLVLLSHLLCISLEEVASLKIHERQNTNTTDETVARISKKARRWNKADAAFYDYFNASLWRKIEHFGFDRMAAEVQELREINQRMGKLCLDNKYQKNTRKSDLHQENDEFWKSNSYEPQGVVFKHHVLKENSEAIKECTYLVASPRKFTQYAFQVQNKTKPFRTSKRFDQNVRKMLKNL